MRLDPGATFGRYTIVSLLGEGGMGSVYRAVDTKLERPVALKLLRPDRVKDDTFERAKGADRLLREARAAATITHGNAVAIYDVGEVEGTPYIAMELVVGRSLRACVGDSSVSIETRVRWLVDTARALAAAHARGIVHRDVKPENVMLAEDGAIKVLDFGIASSYGRTDAAAATATNWAPSDYDEWFASFSRDGVLVGTPRYMSPEQLNGAPLDGRADQFSWGVMAYELLSGEPPWLGDTVSYATLLDLLHKDPTPIQRVAPALPSGLARAVHKSLAKSADERFASMDELILALSEPKPAKASNARQWFALAAVATVSGAGALWLGGSFSRTLPPAMSSAGPTTAQVIPAPLAPPTLAATSSAPPMTMPSATPAARVVTSSRGKVESAPPVAADAAAAPTATASATAPARFRSPGF